MNEAFLLQIRIQLEQIITQREGMVAENKHLMDRGLRPAYGEESFEGLVAQMDHLILSIRSM